MDRTEAKMILTEDVVKWARLALQLQRWDITIEWGRIEGECKSPDRFLRGLTRADPLYARAVIEIDEAGHDDADDLKQTFRHELLHIFHAEFALSRRQVAQAVDSTTLNIIDEAYEHCAEATLRQMEMNLDNALGLTFDPMIELAKQQHESVRTTTIR